VRHRYPADWVNGACMERAGTNARPPMNARARWALEITDETKAKKGRRQFEPRSQPIPQTPNTVAIFRQPRQTSGHKKPLSLRTGRGVWGEGR
jgi:hypothetical protein